MLQDISPHRLNNEYRPAVPSDDDLVFVFSDKGSNAMLRAFDDSGHLIDRPVTDEYPVTPKLIFPRILDYRQNVPARLASLIWLFSVDDHQVFLDPAPDPVLLPGYAWLSTRLFRRGLPAEFSFAGATAWHLKEWYMSSRFCGRCGAPARPDRKERAMRCTSCGSIVYPRINPAVIIGVVKGDSILLTRYANRPYKGRALIAGYCEIGETPEQTVSREVMEEAGIRVSNITYYKSQPWGFDSGLLLGYYCMAEEGEIRIAHDELSEAYWCKRSDIGELPGVSSLTNEMIANFRDNILFL